MAFQRKFSSFKKSKNKCASVNKMAKKDYFNGSYKKWSNDK